MRKHIDGAVASNSSASDVVECGVKVSQKFHPTCSICNRKIVKGEDSAMGLSKTEVNLRRLLATAPQQQNQEKLIHYVATLREQLEQLAKKRSPEGLPRVSKAQLNERSEKIEAIAAKLDVTESSTQVS